MTAIRCFVGQLGAPQTPVPLPLRLDGRQPGAFLNAAAASAGAALAVTMDYTKLHDVAEPPEASSFFLHHALGRLTLNGPDPACVPRIGILLADKYADDHKAFGYMFDTGFDPAIGDQSFNAVAREGCVIFLDAIREQREAIDDYRTEVGFTAVHELGHVFNLWHVDTPSFMAQSRPSDPFGSSAFKFVDQHRAYLGAIDSRFVCPGGSQWEDRGDLVTPPEDPFNAAAARRVRMRIAMPQEEFWCFEPVQLDVSIATVPGVEQTRIPDAVDPGYDTFAVWIEAPDGTRRKYRSPVHYCDTKAQRTIRRGAPFTRDIPIFGQSGGYTFRLAGPHRIFCTFRLRDGSMTTSNVVDAFVKPASRRSARFARLREALTTRPNAQTMFYRNALRPSRVVEPLESAARDLKGTPAAANIRYSVARSLATTARVRSRSTRMQYEKTAARLLKTALDSGCLSQSRQRRAAEIVSGLNDR